MNISNKLVSIDCSVRQTHFDTGKVQASDLSPPTLDNAETLELLYTFWASDVEEIHFDDSPRILVDR